MTTVTLIYEGDGPGRQNGDAWWYYRVQETGVLVGVKNARVEPDWVVHEDGTGYQVWDWEYDDVAVCEGEPTRPGTELPWRPMTDEERDDYVDAVREALRETDG